MANERQDEGGWFEEGEALQANPSDPAKAATVVAGMLGAHRRDLKRGRIILWGNTLLALGILVFVLIRGAIDGIALVGLVTVVFAVALSFQIRRRLHTFAGGIQELEAIHQRLMEEAARQSDKRPS